MFNPLIENIEQLKDQELESKINDLTNKYFMTKSPYLREQIVSFLETYKEVYQTRKQQELENIMKTQNKDLDNLININ